MKTYRITFTPTARRHLMNLYEYIEFASASRTTAARFTHAIIDYCEGLRTFPNRGTLREDLGQGIRVTNFKGSTVITFRVEQAQVTILGVFYGGQDYESHPS